MLPTPLLVSWKSVPQLLLILPEILQKTWNLLTLKQETHIPRTPTFHRFSMGLHIKGHGKRSPFYQNHQHKDKLWIQEWMKFISQKTSISAHTLIATQRTLQLQNFSPIFNLFTKGQPSCVNIVQKHLVQDEVWTCTWASTLEDTDSGAKPVGPVLIESRLGKNIKINTGKDKMAAICNQMFHCHSNKTSSKCTT